MAMLILMCISDSLVLSKNFLQGNVRDRRVDTGEDRRVNTGEGKDYASERERRKHRHLAEEKYSRQMEVLVTTMAIEKEVSH